MAEKKQAVRKYVPPPPKRTSQGTDHKPKNKHARKNFKAYRGQGKRR